MKLGRRRSISDRAANTTGPDDFWALPIERVLADLKSGANGLTSPEAASRRKSTGSQAPHHLRTELVLLLRQFSTPITLILLIATVLSAVLGETTDAGIVFGIVLISGMLSFWQEDAASRAMEELLKTAEVTVEVKRDGASVYVPAHDVVPGDVVVLDTGDLIPGDCRLIAAEDQRGDEAPLTGESYPSEKAPGVVGASTELVGRSNCLFRGTHVVRGNAEALVVQVGQATEFGRVAERLEQRVPPTSFERGIGAFGVLLLRVMVVLVAAVFAINVALDRPLVDSLLFSLALAVGLTPQLLPAIVSISLSLGARMMSSAGVIVKRLSAIEDFGAMDVLCTDKTGTITQGNVTLHAAVDVAGDESDAVGEFAYLNAFHHSGYANPIDDAILAAHQHEVPAERIEEIPYDFMRKRLSVLVRRDGECTLIMKGAFESVLASSTRLLVSSGGVEPLPATVDSVRARFASLSQEGYRVLAVAYKPMPSTTKLALEDEAEMIFAGFLAFEDPPKPGVRQLLDEIGALGISLRLVTGDNRLAAAHVAHAVGMDVQSLLIGSEVDKLDDTALQARVETTTLFAEVDPLQKERIVRALRHAGHTVGFLGDGINDAPALHAADVGISVDTAADVAKDSASIVLLRKDLEVLIQGVRLGRQTFANTLKYVFVTTSANFGNMASVAAATLLLPFLPMLPLQILLLNFLSDLPAMTISSDSVDPEQVEKPEGWDIHSIRAFMIVFGAISSAFDLLTFAVLRLAFDASQDVFRSAWFLESLGTELGVMLVLRTRRRFYLSRPSKLLAGTSLATLFVGLGLVLTPVGSGFGFSSVPAPVLLCLVAILAGYVIATEAGKTLFSHRSPTR
jgi:Mg2+-importing ATPase